MELPPSTFLKNQRYQIETTIGQGGFGITYRGRDSKTSSYVAIKENFPDVGIRKGTQIIWMRTTSKEQQEQLQKFKNEAQYLSQCIHPHIVRVYDWFEENNTAYVVMKFISGDPLAEFLIAEEMISQSYLLHYFKPIAAALQVIHLHNLLHRDIKPDNILIDSQDRAILIDFGAAREYIAGKTGRMTEILTPGYAPIEQYNSLKKRGAGTDIYALCATMYHLLTKEPPPDSIARYPEDILIPPRKIVPQINPQLEQIILTGMARDLSQRFSSAGELLQALNLIEENTTARLIHLKAPMLEFILDGSQTIIGRSDINNADVRVDLANCSHADTVSRYHGVIYREGKKWKVKDLSSSNGIFIKSFGQNRFGGRITAPEILLSGDEVAFGKVRFLFQNF